MNAHMGIKATFEVADVAVLLRVHLVVRKDKLHIVEHELHGGQLVLVTGFELRLSGWDPGTECSRTRTSLSRLGTSAWTDRQEASQFERTLIRLAASVQRCVSRELLLPHRDSERAMTA